MWLKSITDVYFLRCKLNVGLEKYSYGNHYLKNKNKQELWALFSLKLLLQAPQAKWELYKTIWNIYCIIFASFEILFWINTYFLNLIYWKSVYSTHLEIKISRLKIDLAWHRFFSLFDLFLEAYCQIKIKRRE